MKNEYLQFLLLAEIRRKEFIEPLRAWSPLRDMGPIFEAAMQSAISRRGYETTNTYDGVVKNLITTIQVNGGITTEGDEYTGQFFTIVEGRYQTLTKDIHTGSEVAKRLTKLGPRALVSAIAKIAEEDGWGGGSEKSNENADFLSGFRSAPAADRIVSFDHNSADAKEIEEGLNQVCEAVRGDNESRLVPDIEKPRILSQIRASLDLIKTGRISTRALSALIYPILAYLAIKFGDELIGQLATKLMEALSSLIGTVF